MSCFSVLRQNGGRITDIVAHSYQRFKDGITSELNGSDYFLTRGLMIFLIKNIVRGGIGVLTLASCQASLRWMGVSCRNILSVINGLSVRSAFASTVAACFCLSVLQLGGAVIAVESSKHSAGSLAGLSHLFVSAAVAQETEDATVEKIIPGVDKNKPMLIQADDLIYDNKNNRVVAHGNVEIYYNNYTLLANDVIYDRGSSKLVADGNVRIKEPDGALVKAERIVLTDDFKEGFIRSLQVVTQDETRIGASEAIRREGNVTEFVNGVFTPCKTCKDNPEKAPLWRIKAKRVIHDKNAKTISYEDATFDVFGQSIAYMPYFSHPDPTVKRKSGFLIPRPSHSQDLGYGVETPYFFNLAPNYDFTFSPTFLTEKGVLLKGNWRHRLKNGSYSVNIAGIYESDKDPESPSDDRFRGSIVSEGKFAVGSDWDFGWDVTYESDDTFRRFYKLDNIKREDRVSNIYLVGQKDRNYFSANAYQFGGLLANDTADSESIVHPVIDYNYIYSDPVLGGELSFNTNILSLTRNDEGVDVNRLSTDVQWRRKFVDGIGQVITPFAKLRGDVYSTANYVNPITGLAEDDDVNTRGMATGGVEYRFPLVSHTENASHVIEPIAQFIARSDLSRGDQLEISNEDARSLVFDDTLLFDLDKFSGYDRLETGMRANVGLQYTLQHYSGGYMRAVFGQSYHIDGDNAYALDVNPEVNKSGLETDDSDFVAGLYLEPNSNLTFVSQSRFDEKTFEINRQDFSTRFKTGPLTTNLNYAYLAGGGENGLVNDEQEILASARLQVTQYWSLFGGIRYDLENDFRLSDYVGVQYSDECFSLSVAYNESFIDDRDVDPDKSVKVFFTLKHLGEFGTDTTGGGLSQ